MLENLSYSHVARMGITDERILSPKQVYACDLGINFLFIGKRDLSKYFENYIFLQLLGIELISLVEPYPIEWKNS